MVTTVTGFNSGANVALTYGHVIVNSTITYSKYDLLFFARIPSRLKLLEGESVNTVKQLFSVVFYLIATVTVSALPMNNKSERRRKYTN